MQMYKFREYSVEWKKYGDYNQNLRSMIRSKNDQNTTLSFMDVQSYVRKMKKLQSSISELVGDFAKKHNQYTPQSRQKREEKHKTSKSSNQSSLKTQSNLNLVKMSSVKYDDFDGCVLNDVETEEVPGSGSNDTEMNKKSDFDLKDTLMYSVNL